MAIVRPGATAQTMPSAADRSAAARAFRRVVIPLVVHVAAVGLAGWLLLVAPVSTIAAAVVVAIPCALVWLRGARY